MPKIEPYSSQVTWNKDEKTIGVVGVAPWATLDFCKALYSLIDAQKDWHYPRLLIDSNSKIPSRGRYLELNERDPSPYIKSTIDELYSAGAEVVVVPCNTAHILYERWSIDTPAKVPNIINACCKRIAQLNGTKVAVFESLSLRKSGLYANNIIKQNIAYEALEEKDADFIANCIEHVKKNGLPSTDCKQAFNQLISNLSQKGVDTIILGCTELSVFLPNIFAQKIKFIDSNTEIARAAVTLANCRVKGN